MRHTWLRRHLMILDSQNSQARSLIWTGHCWPPDDASAVRRHILRRPLITFVILESTLLDVLFRGGIPHSFGTSELGCAVNLRLLSYIIFMVLSVFSILELGSSLASTITTTLVPEI